LKHRKKQHLPISNILAIFHTTERRHIKLHLKLQASQLVNHNLVMCHTLNKLPTTKWIACQILSFYLKLKMMTSKMNMHFSKVQIMNMNMMLHLVNNEPMARRTLHLSPFSLIRCNQTIHHTQVSTTTMVVKTCK
jgi:hypothetical protein